MWEVEKWIGKEVEIVDGFKEILGERGVVLAVDDTHYRPSAWVKVSRNISGPAYRSCDLCWLKDLETGETGPVWGTKPDDRS